MSQERDAPRRRTEAGPRRRPAPARAAPDPAPSEGAPAPPASRRAKAPSDDALGELFSSRMRAAVLGELLPRPHLAFSLTDLSRRLGLPISSLQHECYKLDRMGVLVDERAGAARRYRPNPDWPLLAPLTTLVAAAIGPEAALRGAVEGVGGLAYAAVCGLDRALTRGRAAGGETPVYLVVVGTASVETIDAVLARCAVALAPTLRPRPLELAYFLPAEWSARRASANAFLGALLAGPTITLIGTPDAG